MDIEFGKLEQAVPQIGIRPDEDGQMLVAAVGQPAPNDLKIYVDLDAMRDMEAHALSNTRVELGGVMLGYQRIDQNGIPFVVVSDCLRAEHYHATKGSFKFTHETWSQITRDREKFRPELEMVGWYHTHPGWSVFLSGMDLFICENFFNRPLDLALVIDPCEGDRGWFQWLNPELPEVEAAEPPGLEANANAELQKKAGAFAPLDATEPNQSETERRTRRTRGFFLTTNRFRSDELDYFSRLYNRQPLMNHDPRYPGKIPGTPIPGTSPFAHGSAMVNLLDNRRPILEIAIIGMLMMQMLTLVIFGWRMATLDTSRSSTQSVVTDERIARLEKEVVQDTRQKAYQEILQTIVGGQTGESNLVEKYTKLKTSFDQASSNLEAQIAVAEQLKKEREKLLQEFSQTQSANERLSAQLQETREDLSSTRKLVSAGSTVTSDQGQASVENPSSKDARSFGQDLPLWATIGSAIGIFLIGGGLGYLGARSRESTFEPVAKAYTNEKEITKTEPDVKKLNKSRKFE